MFLGGFGSDLRRESGLRPGSETDLCRGPDLLPRELKSLTATSFSIIAEININLF